MNDRARLKFRYAVGNKSEKTYRYRNTLFYVISVPFDRYYIFL